MFRFVALPLPLAGILWLCKPLDLAKWSTICHHHHLSLATFSVGHRRVRQGDAHVVARSNWYEVAISHRYKRRMMKENALTLQVGEAESTELVPFGNGSVVHDVYCLL